MSAKLDTTKQANEVRDTSLLALMKKKENKHKKLVRVNILNGYVLTTCPKKWKDHDLSKKKKA